MSRANRFNNRPAFTFVELVIVVAMIGTVLCLLIPLVRRMREQDHSRVQCMNNLRQIGIAMHDCNDAVGHLPPTMGWLLNPHECKDRNSYGSVFWHLLPYTGVHGGPLFQDAFRGPVAVPTKVWEQPVSFFVCPDDPTWNSGRQGSYVCNYLVFGGGNANWENGVAIGPDIGFGTKYGGSNWNQYAKIPGTFQDGTSNTIVFTERLARCPDSCETIWSWCGTTGIDCHQPVFNAVPGFIGPNSKFIIPSNARQCTWQIPSTSHGMMVVGMGDASSRLVHPAITTQTWSAACTPANGDGPQGDW
jgi:type II secretory pathway pseudopilin PulG